MILAAVATACTESGIIDTPAFYANEISFDPYVGKTPVTKAESVDEVHLQRSIDNGGGVQVYGFLQDVGVTTPSSIDTSSPYMEGQLTYVDGAWTYANTAFWPEDNALAFAAYGLNATTCMSNISDDKMQFDFTVKPDVSQQVDLLASPFMTNLQCGEADTQVNLVLKHLLSRIGFSILSSSGSKNIDIAIRSIKLKGIFPTTGRVDLKSTTAAITPDTEGATATEYVFFSDAETCFMTNSEECVTESQEIYANMKFDMTKEEWDKIYVANDASADNRYMMIMPCTGDVTIEVQYQLTEDQPRYAKVSLPSWTFKAGFSYEFVLRVSTQTIQFEAHFGEWGNPVTTEVTLNPIS